jgi:hypothetical protein
MTRCSLSESPADGGTSTGPRWKTRSSAKVILFALAERQLFSRLPWPPDDCFGSVAVTQQRPHPAKSEPSIRCHKRNTFEHMTQSDWYRQTEWTSSVEKEFECRLARSRGQRSEYLRIQALTLAEQNVSELASVAINLAKRQLELSPEGISAAQMWATIAKASTQLDRHNDTVEAYRHSVRLEARRPNVRGYHYIDFAWYAATNSAVEIYPEVLAAIEEIMQEQDLVFPLIQYRFFGALALMAADSGDTSKAQRMALNAISAANKERGPFWRRPFLGLIKGNVDVLRSRLERLAGRKNDGSDSLV